MEIRTMEYYLAVVREGNISAAAKALHIAQPSLSRQMKDLEDELHTTLFVRGNRKITLTEEGMILRKRAEEMVQLAQMTQEEISQVRNHMTGTIKIGAGESRAFHYLSLAASKLIQTNPNIHLQIVSGDTEDLMDQLNNGLLDFAFIFTEVDHTLYQSITLPEEDHFAVLMPKTSPLAQKEVINATDLNNLPIIVSRASYPFFSNSEAFSSLNIVAIYNLIYNASLLVEDGCGYAICFDHLINTSGKSNLCIRPLVPTIKTAGHLIWKKYQMLSPAVQLYIKQVKEILALNS